MSESPMERRLIWTEKRVTTLEQQLATKDALLREVFDEWEDFQRITK